MAAMEQQKIPRKATVARLVRAIRAVAGSESGWKAKTMFAALILLLCGANGLNVANSYVNRSFMTSIVERNQSQFVRLAVLYIVVFAASTVVTVIARFMEERLALSWREFVTGRMIGVYLAGGACYRLSGSAELTNPDQRISEDARLPHGSARWFRSRKRRNSADENEPRDRYDAVLVRRDAGGSAWTPSR
jgi:putative ATP-binding cassette transporter